MLCAGCTAHVAPTLPPSKVTAQASEAAGTVVAQPVATPTGEACPVPEKPLEALVAQAAEPSDADAQAAAAATIPDGVDEEAVAAADDEEDDDSADSADEGEAQEAPTSAVPNGPLYTAELSDEQLTELWKNEPKSLGSISVGFVESGRMVNSVRVPESDDWIVVSPELAYGTQETVEYLTKAIREVRAQYPNAPPLRVNQLSSRDGGYLRPHKSHQNGRDVDLGFYYPTAEPIRVRERERYINLELNWALIKSLATHSDVQMILVDKRVIKVLHDYALSKGENKEWLDSIFNAGAQSLVKHAKRHRDHFHVRFFNPRAQELGRRVAPLLALQPDKNIMMHRVRSGDTLGGIALRYGSSITGIKKTNRMRSILLRIGQVLAVPLRGPCTRCPIPPAVVVPPRRLPPGFEQAPALATPQPSPAPAQQVPVASESQPAVAAQQAPAPEQQPAVAAPQEHTGGSAPAGADTSTETQPQPPSEPQQQAPAVQGSPASTQTSAAVSPVRSASASR